MFLLTEIQNLRTKRSLAASQMHLLSWKGILPLLHLRQARYDEKEPKMLSTGLSSLGK
jgi:hypothetical protein